MNKCPIETCGRTFQSPLVLEEHLRRRHPKFRNESTHHPLSNSQQQQGNHLQEIKKLPKIRQLKPQSRQKKASEVLRKSLSKNKHELNTTANTSKVTAIISDSRNYLEKSQIAHKTTKRPSLSKKNSSSDLLSAKQEKLPEIKGSRLKKLELLDSHKHTAFEEKDLLYSTAPNFKKFELKESTLRERSKSKEKGNASYFEEQSKVHKISATEELAFVKTQQGFREKETKLHSHRPLLKRPIEKEKMSESVFETRVEKQSVAQPREGIASGGDRGIRQLKKDLKSKISLRRDNSLKKGELKQELAQNYDFEEKIVVFKPGAGSRLTLPSTAKCEFVFANNCGLSSISLSNIETLRELSLMHNNIKDLSFLHYPHNESIEKLFLDHNQLVSLDFLPPSIRVLSLTFNQIEGLEDASRQLSRLLSLQEVDFTFNPIRKEGNYRLHVISCCRALRKIDGIKVTKFDLEMAAEYARLMDEELGLIPSSKVRDLVVSKCSPSTVVSAQNEQQQEIGMNYEELEKEVAKITKTTRQTRDNLEIIRQENDALRREMGELRCREQEETQGDPGALYDKLRAECQALELLNFLQYASEEELVQLIAKKQQVIVS